MNLAPIILFTYNRPDHTEKTLEALMANSYANQSSLIIFNDGAPASSSALNLKRIKEVRSTIRKKQWCKEVTIIEREKNLGLANNVIDGVSLILKEHSSVIVLEDDIVTGKYFLKFMNEALTTYANDDKVYGVTGHKFKSKKNITKPTYFLPVMSSWGYGTWRDRWEKISFDGAELLKTIDNNNASNMLNFGHLHYYQMLQDQVAGRNDSWAVRFLTSMFLDNGIFLYPNRPLLVNIGLDGSGVHCNNNQDGEERRLVDIHKDIQVQRIAPVLDNKIVNHFKNAHVDNVQNVKMNVKKKLKRFIAPELIQLAKRKLQAPKDKEHQRVITLERYTPFKTKLLGIEIDVPDNASFLFMKDEIFKDEMYKFQSENYKPIIIDGGANIGLSTIYFKNLYPDAQITAFEPDPEIFGFLKRNLKSFGYTDVALMQKALWNMSTTLSFESEGADAGLIADESLVNPKVLEVEAISVKPYLKQTVDFLKLDIEGAETEVLIDIKDSLSNVKRIFVEYHSFIGKEQTLDTILTILREEGFRLYVSSPGLLSKSPFVQINTYNNMDMQLNIYGIKQNLK